jgi:hypothetical protein
LTSQLDSATDAYYIARTNTHTAKLLSILWDRQPWLTMRLAARRAQLNVGVAMKRSRNGQSEATVESLAAEFRTYGKAAAEQVILRCKTVATAKAKLGYSGFQEFCLLVRLEPKSSTCRKYKLIGAEADWLQPIAAHLPGDWTTIYDVVKLGQSKAEELIGLGTLHPQVTAKNLKAAATMKAVPKASDDVVGDAIGTTEPCVFRVDASDLSDQDRLSLYDDLEKASAGFALAVTGLPKRLAKTIIIEREAA